jgi:hypothetical protein
LLTIPSGISQIRYATLKGIMAAKKKEIKEVTRPRRWSASVRIQARQKIYLPQKMKQTQMLCKATQKPAPPSWRRSCTRSRVIKRWVTEYVFIENKGGTAIEFIRSNRGAPGVWIATEQQVSAVVLGPSVALAQEIAAYDIERYCVNDPKLADEYTPDAYADALEQIVKQADPNLVFPDAHLPGARLRAEARRAFSKVID